MFEAEYPNKHVQGRNQERNTVYPGTKQQRKYRCTTALLIRITHTTLPKKQKITQKGGLFVMFNFHERVPKNVA